MLFLRVIAWYGAEKISLKKSCFYLYIRRKHEYNRTKTRTLECNHCPQKKEYPARVGPDFSKRNFNIKKDLFSEIPNLILVTPSQWLANLLSYCCVSVTHKVTLGEIVDLLEEFKAQPVSLMMPKCPEGSFAKKLFSLYLTYLPADKFKYAMKMNCDDRGSFTELVHTVDCGQVSINISKPGITKGQHWHNSKWEQFIVVHGHGLIQERNINTGETVEFEVSGDKIEAIYMIPGWTHNIINLSETDDLVTVMTCNEIFDPGHPDTFFEPV